MIFDRSGGTAPYLGRYVLWDILTGILEKVKFVKRDNSGDYLKKPVLNTTKVFMRWISPSLVGLIISYYLFENMKGVNTENGVVLVDLLLLLTFFGFRGWKTDLKQNYKLEEWQIPDGSLLDNFDFTKEEKIKVHDEDITFGLKYFLYRILPILGLIATYLYFTLHAFN